jgi:hypothetical protein
VHLLRPGERQVGTFPLGGVHDEANSAYRRSDSSAARVLNLAVGRMPRLSSERYVERTAADLL